MDNIANPLTKGLRRELVRESSKGIELHNELLCVQNRVDVNEISRLKARHSVPCLKRNLCLFSIPHRQVVESGCTTALDVVPWETDGESVLRESCLARFLKETTPQVEPPAEGQSSNAQAVQAVEAWKHSDFLCHNYVTIDKKVVVFGVAYNNKEKKKVVIGSDDSSDLEEYLGMFDETDQEEDLGEDDTDQDDSDDWWV
ncbi:hypothetical protein Tco_1404067 [Tanacetum coccineum]